MTIGATPTGNGKLNVASASTTAGDAAIIGMDNGNAAVYGIYGQSSSTTDNAIGVFGNASGASGATIGVWGQSATSGAGVGTGGYISSGTGFAIDGFNADANGTAIIGVGNNVSGSYPTDGCGITGSGSSFGTVGFASSGTGTGVVGVGNNAPSPFQTPLDGAGVSGNGTEAGVWGYANNSGGTEEGGYFQEGHGSFAYVGYYDGATQRKIIGNGSVSTIVKNTSNQRVVLTCPEAPEILFQDYGSGTLQSGKAHIDIDPTLSKNIYVDDNHPLKVFIQLENNCKGVYVTNKTANGFDVIELDGGSSNAKFSWFLTANRADDYNDEGKLCSKNVNSRFPLAPGPMQMKSAAAKESPLKLTDKKESFIKKGK